MRKIFKTSLILMLMLFIYKVNAAPVNEAFNDDNFYNCIVVKLNTDGFGSVYNRDPATHSVTTEELESLTVLKCNESGINDVKGIELLKNLTDLNLSDNQISTIDLSKNTKITNLLLSNNKISTIDLTKNVDLENLYLDNNKVSSIDLSKNAQLLVLNINNNSLSTLDLSQNTKLIDLKALSAFKEISQTLYKNSTLTITPDIKFSSEIANYETWNIPSWLTKDANIATISQKGLVKGLKNGSVSLVASVDSIYNITYKVLVLEATSDEYNIDDENSTIFVTDKKISTILSKIKVENGEALIYNAKDKYVTSGNIEEGFKLKIMHDAKIVKTYDLSIVEEIANNNLKSLEVKGYTITFDPEKTNYTIIVENDVDKVEVLAEAEETKNEITIEGNEEIIVGSNEVKVTVTSSDGSTKTYIITVVKKNTESEENPTTENAYLESIDIKNYKIAFDKKKFDYELEIKPEVNALEIHAVPFDSQATVEIKGNENLKNKSIIKINVTSSEGETVTYNIKVIKKDSSTIKTIITILELIAILLVIILCIILINKHNKKQKNVKKVVKENIDEVKTEEVKMVKTPEVQEVKVEEPKHKQTREEYVNSDAYLEKTIRFRRVCKHCGSVNVLTNDKCYLCGKKLDEIK